tara:strand:- start:124 stop:546 length:423 start_codon:yes stop_codon:yes gene_type:complete
MKRYVYDKRCILVNEIEAGEFDSFPTRSTLVVPPSLRSGEYAKFNGIEWLVITELPEVSEPIPAQIGMDQAKLALYDEGLIDAVELAIDALPVGQKKRVKIEWNTRTTVRRNRGLVSKVLKAAGLSETDIDNLFVLANTL